MNQILIIAAAFAALVVAYNVLAETKKAEGRQQESARVSQEAGKKDAIAQTRRRAVTADGAHGVLEKYYRD